MKIVNLALIAFMIYSCANKDKTSDNSEQTRDFSDMVDEPDATYRIQGND